jgi:soluble lytic murein transglycosylase-like protein
MPSRAPGQPTVDYPADQKAIVDEAAKAHGLPGWVLQGVWGMETDFGKNVATSSAGAVGDFQFIPSTAKVYGYPMTNTPNAQQFTQQANIAADYLSKLKQSTGSWDAALKSYSGGGYGVKEVQAKATSAPFNQSTGPNLPKAVGDAVDTVTGIPGAITDVFNTAVKDAKYAVVTVAILIVGVMLITRAFSGGGGSGEKVKVIPV